MVLKGRTARVGIHATYTSPCAFMYLRVLCYRDACLKSSALRVRLKTLTPVVLKLGFANLHGFTGRFPGVVGWQLRFHLLLFFNILYYRKMRAD